MCMKEIQYAWTCMQNIKEIQSLSTIIYKKRSENV